MQTVHKTLTFWNILVHTLIYSLPPRGIPSGLREGLWGGGMGQEETDTLQGCQALFSGVMLNPFWTGSATGGSVRARGLLFLLMRTSSSLTFPLARILFLKLDSSLLPTLLAS